MARSVPLSCILRQNLLGSATTWRQIICPTPSSEARPGAALAGAILTVDLDAVVANYRLLSDKLRTAACGAVVKADAYELGAGPVATALWGAGCRHFFVAQLDEAHARRGVLPDAPIHVMNGLLPGQEGPYCDMAAVPVLNDLGQIEAWSRHAKRLGTALPAIIHLDTGMCRLGLSLAEIDRLAAEPDRLDGLDVHYLMSHLAIAERPDHPMNARQRAAFHAALQRLPRAPASLANSSGIFLGPEYHFDVVRPGVALYGVAPVEGQPNPMAPVIHLQGRILQVRDVDSPQTVGYGATHSVGGPGKIATVALGYADGYLRHLSSRGRCYVGDIQVPVVGRVSMDLISLDVTAVPERALAPGGLVEVAGGRYTVDDAATDAGTIGYEILTSLGRRYSRCYLGGRYTH